MRHACAGVLAGMSLIAGGCSGSSNPPETAVVVVEAPGTAAEADADAAPSKQAPGWFEVLHPTVKTRSVRLPSGECLAIGSADPYRTKRWLVKPAPGPADEKATPCDGSGRLLPSVKGFQAHGVVLGAGAIYYVANPLWKAADAQATPAVIETPPVEHLGNVVGTPAALMFVSFDKKDVHRQDRSGSWTTLGLTKTAVKAIGAHGDTAAVLYENGDLFLSEDGGMTWKPRKHPVRAPSEFDIREDGSLFLYGDRGPEYGETLSAPRARDHFEESRTSTEMPKGLLTHTDGGPIEHYMFGRSLDHHDEEFAASARYRIKTFAKSKGMTVYEGEADLSQWKEVYKDEFSFGVSAITAGKDSFLIRRDCYSNRQSRCHQNRYLLLVREGSQWKSELPPALEHDVADVPAVFDGDKGFYIFLRNYKPLDPWLQRVAPGGKSTPLAAELPAMGGVPFPQDARYDAFGAHLDDQGDLRVLGTVRTKSGQETIRYIRIHGDQIVEQQELELASLVKKVYPHRIAAYGRRVVVLEAPSLYVSEDGGKTFTRHEPAAFAGRELNGIQCGRAGCNFFISSLQINDYPLAWRWGEGPATP